MKFHGGWPVGVGLMVNCKVEYFMICGPQACVCTVHVRSLFFIIFSLILILFLAGIYGRSNGFGIRIPNEADLGYKFRILYNQSTDIDFLCKSHKKLI